MARHTVVMVTSSYPRFPGDAVGTFMEPIAHGVAARGHQVHVVAPWHPLVRRPSQEGAVRFHFYRYAPHPALNVFGYAGALRADVALRGTAWMAAPFALLAGWRMARQVAQEHHATVMHGHWVVPGGATAWLARTDLPLVVSLHGSDVYVAERHAVARAVARRVLTTAGWVTACSADLLGRAHALGAASARSEVVPYGVDAQRFAPDVGARAALRTGFGVTEEGVVLAVGRLVRKKGFSYLVDAVATLAARGRPVRLILAGGGDLADELRAQADRAGISAHVTFTGTVAHDRIPGLLAGADIVAVPSVRDDSGNVDGLPNVALEALVSGTAVIATPAGGITQVLQDGETGLLVPERDPVALAAAIERLLDDPVGRTALGERARRDIQARFGWGRVAERFEAAYDAASHRPR